VCFDSRWNLFVCPDQFWFGFVFLAMILAIALVLFAGVEFSMESLILAQDERWRRA
jgi:hypothetical protein